MVFRWLEILAMIQCLMRYFTNWKMEGEIG